MKTEQLNEGVLCQLRVGRWGASIRMSKDKFGDDIPTEIVRGMQDLVDDRTILQDLLTLKREAKRELVNSSIAFPVDNVFWVPKHKIEHLDERLREIKEQYIAGTEDLIANMDKLKKQFRRKYKAYYDPENYPDEHQIRAKYYFKWSFFQFQLPDKKAGILTASMYKREQEKFKKMAQEMEEMAINVIGNTLLARINRLREQCEGDKINAGTLNSLDKFLWKWDDLWSGTIDNKKMKGIMRTLRIQMKKTSAEGLRNSEDFRTQVADKMTKVADQLKAIPDFKIKRKLDI